MAAKPRDPYQVLGVQVTTAPDEIKSAYRKLALKYHPDKNQGVKAADSAEHFQEVTTAYGILSDPEKRRKYDQGGFDNLNPSDLQVEVDLTSLGFVNTAVAALFNKLGVPIKTVVAQNVLEAAYSGNFNAIPLSFGERQQDEVKKAGVVFYEMNISQQHIDDGFAIGAHSAAGSRFKLLLFEQASDGQWELLIQEDSAKSKKGSQMAGLFMFPWQTCSIAPKPSSLETANNPEAVLFQHLESLQQREQIHVHPGRILVAVYGDNWFNKVRFTIQAVHTAASQPSASAAEVQKVEAQLLQKKSEMRLFESQYRQAQAQFEAAVKQFNVEQKEVEGLLQKRDDAYLDMLAINEDRTSMTAASTHGDFPLKGWGRRKG